MSIEGLKAYREQKEKEKKSYFKFYKPPADKKVKIRPLQELDPDSKNYNQEVGLAVFTKEWQNPQDFTKVIVDTTEEEGACLGQELLDEYGWGDGESGDPTIGWRPKERLYVNVLVDEGDELFVGVLQCNLGKNAVQGPTLIDFSDNSDDHSITDRWWTFVRTGSGFGTKYTLTPGDKSKLDTSKYELFDLNEVTPRVPYSNQKAALGAQSWIDNYGEKVKSATAAKRGKSNTPAPVSQEW